MVENYLAGLFTQHTDYDVLLQAMRYSLLAGGKRIRPILCISFAEAVGGLAEDVLPIACAVELIHTYSLIHDDLPCMDNDDYRRGKLTCHKVYGDNIATLAGDALLTAAFSVLTSADVPAERLLECTRLLAKCAGENGMVAGQVLDLNGEGKQLTKSQLDQIHTHKTGDMIYAACAMGVIAAGGIAEQLKAAQDYAYGIGLAFQIRDDMLDEIGDMKELGKPIGSDASNDKFTYVTLFGIDRCQELVEAETDKAVRAISNASFEHSEFLTELASQLSSRNK